MKKTTFLIISLFLLICINACAGYKPIFASSTKAFAIALVFFPVFRLT